MELAALVLPTQFALDHPTPVTIPIFSSCDSLESAAAALVYASSQVPTVRFEVRSSVGIAVMFVSVGPFC
jgi:hypothetical protein